MDATFSPFDTAPTSFSPFLASTETVAVPEADELLTHEYFEAAVDQRGFGVDGVPAERLPAGDPGPIYLHANAAGEAAAAGAGAAAVLLYGVLGLGWTAAAIYGIYKFATRKDCTCR